MVLDDAINEMPFCFHPRQLLVSGRTVMEWEVVWGEKRKIIVVCGEAKRSNRGKNG